MKMVLATVPKYEANHNSHDGYKELFTRMIIVTLLMGIPCSEYTKF